MPDQDENLIAEFNARRSEDAFAALVRQHVNLVFATALRQVGDPGRAEEITQNVFVALAQSSGKLGSHPTIAGWLYRTTLNKSREWLRSELRRRHREQVAVNLELANADGNSVWSPLVPLLDEALLDLREPDRLAVIMHFMEGQTFGEVAVALGVKEDAARKRVHRCLSQLTEFFRRRGFNVPGGTVAAPLFAISSHMAPAGLAASATAAGVSAAKAAVATSSLSVFKGTLKFMAWEKTKIAVVTSVAILLATAAIVKVADHLQRQPPSQSGKLNLPTGVVNPMISFGYPSYGIVIASDGSLWSWGDEQLGWPILGLKNIQNTGSLRRIGDQNDWTSVSASDQSVLAIKSDGSLWAWGGNGNHQLGDGTRTTRAEPVPSIAGHDWKVAASGGEGSFAIKNDGTLWAWGNNWAGQLGIGSTKDTTTPEQVGAGNRWSKIWAGGIQTVGLQADGSLWFWGSLTGSDKDGNQLHVPTRVSDDTNWVDVCFTYFTALAIKSDGTLWTWGRDAKFYSGAVDQRVNLTPKQVGTENDWRSCSAASGGYYALLMKKDNSLWALDASERRIIKPDSEYKPVALQRIDLQKDIVAFAAGGDSMGVVMTRDGEVWTWGKVIGEHAQKDFVGPHGEMVRPDFKIVLKPWQLSIVDEHN